MNNVLKQIQKATGIKQGQYDNEKNRLWAQGQTLLKMLDVYVKQVEAAKMTDEQFFIEWEDAVNELSVKDHSVADSE